MVGSIERGSSVQKCARTMSQQEDVWCSTRSAVSLAAVRKEALALPESLSQNTLLRQAQERRFQHYEGCAGEQINPAL